MGFLLQDVGFIQEAKNAFEQALKLAPEGGVLSIYIEGDGHVWRGEFPSQDPTPSYFLALELALRQPRGAIAYLARPCQIVGLGTNPLCNSQQWTIGRYSKVSVDSISNGIDYLKTYADAKKSCWWGILGVAQ